ncbi:peptidylprolyl isomerase [Albimonas sp. CAU 1670]|uniref:peptidylprolyl isomerase n=1 Tax=Albimonas sp. CAU 1670 TaxID=3032599 RepID=UPI0023D9BDFD|nr:peptidylprolyl isomerase [Albimonas sp. CAU 1670]MDF2234616.1 peptidylprolyl isomerase [Albimonas sp. CAU 1670]
MPIARTGRAAVLAVAAAALIPASLAPFAAAAQDAKPAAETAAETTPAPEPTVDTVVATVNGKPVTLAEVIIARASLPQQYQQLPDAQLLPALIDQAVVQELLAQQAQEAGRGDDPIAALHAEIAKKSFLAESEMAKVIAEATSEDKLRALYEEKTASMEPTPQIRASHILVKEKEKADALKAELDGGADFAELARANGTDGTKDRGGDLGWFDEEQMVPAFAEAAFAADENVVVGPVETQFGWHLILVTGKREAPVPTFEEMRAELAQEAARAAATEKVEELRAGADVQMSDPLPDASAIRRDDLLSPK